MGLKEVVMRQTINLEYELNQNVQVQSGRIFLTGTQALLRMLLSQAQRDQAQGLNTAGFVSGYRGSPLGGVDATLWRHQQELQDANIRFQPAINEDLAATMLMGTQQLDTHPDKEVDGRSEEHTSELQSRGHLVCRLLLEKKKITTKCRREHKRKYID